MKRMLTVMLMCVVIGGCTIPIGSTLTQLTPKMQLAGARTTFNAAVRVLTDLRMLGTFTKSQGADFELVVDMGKNILDRWQAQLELGTFPDQSLIRAFNTTMLELQALRVQAERTRNDENGPTVNSTTRPAGTG